MGQNNQWSESLTFSGETTERLRRVRGLGFGKSPDDVGHLQILAGFGPSDLASYLARVGSLAHVRKHLLRILQLWICGRVSRSGARRGAKSWATAWHDRIVEGARVRGQMRGAALEAELHSGMAYKGCGFARGCEVRGAAKNPDQQRPISSGKTRGSVDPFHKGF